ncbi:MAG: hypothetical protein ACR2LJ_09230 [Acidimicrobiales bacterium]
MSVADVGDDASVEAREQELLSEVGAMFAASGFTIAAREEIDEWVVDLVSRRTGDVVAALWGGGPTRSLAVLVAEQRWLVEQVGSGSIAGATYVDKARERLRRWIDETPSGSAS